MTDNISRATVIGATAGDSGEKVIFTFQDAEGNTYRLGLSEILECAKYASSNGYSAKFQEAQCTEHGSEAEICEFVLYDIEGRMFSIGLLEVYKSMVKAMREGFTPQFLAACETAFYG